MPPSLTSHDFARASCNWAPARHSKKREPACIVEVRRKIRMHCPCSMLRQRTPIFNDHAPALDGCRLNANNELIMNACHFGRHRLHRKHFSGISAPTFGTMRCFMTFTEAEACSKSLSSSNQEPGATPLSAGLARTTWLARLTKDWGAIFRTKRNFSWTLGDSPSTKSCSFSKQNESQRWDG